MGTTATDRLIAIASRASRLLRSKLKTSSNEPTTYPGATRNKPSRTKATEVAAISRAVKFWIVNRPSGCSAHHECTALTERESVSRMVSPEIATDGILETGDLQDREFGTEGLRGCVASNPLAPLARLAANILAAAAKWGKQQDDQTLLIVRCISNA